MTQLVRCQSHHQQQPRDKNPPKEEALPPTWAQDRVKETSALRTCWNKDTILVTKYGKETTFFRFSISHHIIFRLLKKEKEILTYFNLLFC